MSRFNKVILLRWEKLRIAYNLILLIEALLLLWEYFAVAIANWRFIVLFAFAANVCYCAGPLIEICLWTLLGSPIDQTRYHSFLRFLPYFLFCVGLGLSMFIVFVITIVGSEYLGGYQ